MSLATAAILFIASILQHESLHVARLQDWYYVFAYAILCQLIGWYLITKSLTKFSISTAGFILLLQPGLSFIWDVLFFHRTTSGIEYIGLSITLVAIYLSASSKRT